jgi:predicted TIM-barrel fold metal-dependent hydrolase
MLRVRADHSGAMVARPRAPRPVSGGFLRLGRVYSTLGDYCWLSSETWLFRAFDTAGKSSDRYLDDLCSKYPHRLKSMIGVSASYIEVSVAEIRRWSRATWAAGVYTSLPIDYPLDHPGLHPIWQAIDEAGLCFIHHSFSQGYPGYRDLWSNPFLGRTASHPWGAMRAMGAFFGAGLFDRYPNLRFAILESGFGWLPFWATRLQDQAHYMGFVAEGLQHTTLEYTTGGPFFASIVLHEGGQMVKLVSDYLGDHLLMFS